jgi:hypothetical protein
MFQFTRFPCLRIIQDHCIGFPHSDTDSCCGCIHLTVAFRSIPRPSSARDAKTSSMSPYSLCPCDTEKRMILIAWALVLPTMPSTVFQSRFVFDVTSYSTVKVLLSSESGSSARSRCVHVLMPRSGAITVFRDEKSLTFAKLHLTTSAMKNLSYLFSSITTVVAKCRLVGFVCVCYLILKVYPLHSTPSRQSFSEEACTSLAE